MEEDKENGHIYNCFNRADEDPFKKIGYNQSEDDGDKYWSVLVRTPCQAQTFRRCLGQKPSQCVDPYGWYIYINNKLLTEILNFQFISNEKSIYTFFDLHCDPRSFLTG